MTIFAVFRRVAIFNCINDYYYVFIYGSHFRVSSQSHKKRSDDSALTKKVDFKTISDFVEILCEAPRENKEGRI